MSMEFSDPAPPPEPQGPGKVVVVATLVIGALLLIGIVPRLVKRAALNHEALAAKTRLPLVSVTSPKRAAPSAELELPGSVQAMHEAVLYPRTNGYVKRFLADIGDRVAAGQVLAEIETPDLDQEYQLARANLELARANLVQAKALMSFAGATRQRWNGMQKEGVVSKQDTDEKDSAYDARAAAVGAADASVAANQANLNRLEELRRFRLVTAPFAGVVTARGIDIGTLVTAASGAGQRELFRIAKTDRMRVMISVPQSLAAGVREGLEVKLQVPELPKRTFDGKVVRSAHALDPASRTLLTEVHIPNPDLALRAGMYGRVVFTMPRGGGEALLIPASALVIGGDGTRVVVVDGGVARYRVVAVGRDFGPEVEVLHGLTEGDTIVTNPTEALTDGMRVEVHKPQAKKA